MGNFAQHLNDLYQAALAIDDQLRLPAILSEMSGCDTVLWAYKSRDDVWTAKIFVFDAPRATIEKPSAYYSCMISAEPLASWCEAVRPESDGRRFVQNHNIAQSQFISSEPEEHVFRCAVRKNIILPISYDRGEKGFFCLCDSNERGFGEERIAGCRALSAHLEDILKLRWRIEKGNVANIGSYFFAEQLSHGVVLVDANLRILYANKQAKEFLTQRRCFKDVRGGFVVLASEVQKKLENLIWRACNENNPSIEFIADACVAVQRQSPSSHLSLMVAPIDPAHAQHALWGRSFERLAMIIITDPDKSPHIIGEVFSTTYGFTPTEARVAQQLLTGQSKQELSECLKISVGTIRWHVKNLMAKTHTNREAQLILKLSHALPPLAAM